MQALAYTRSRYYERYVDVKALILAGGAGTRLRPITHTRAKQLVPVANKPILFYGIEAMVAAGITEIGVIVGDTRDEVMEALGDGSRFGATITYIPQDEPLGLAHCVLIARDFLGDDDFVMYLGDNLLEQDLGAFVSAFEAARAGGLATRRADPAEAGPDPHRFGIATLDAEPATSCSWSRSRPTRRPTWRSSACTCSTRRSTTPCGDRAVGARRARDHRRHPVADRRRERVRCELLTGGGSTPASSPRCSRRTGCCSRSSSGASTARSTSVGARRPGAWWTGRRGRQLDHPRAGRDRPGAAWSTASSARSRRSVPAARWSTARSSTRS
jgi:CTP:molybdopterin cytidylyltransferase MocA